MSNAADALADSESGMPSAAAASLQVTAHVTGLAEAISHQVALAGPGDVKALATDRIRTVFPEPDARDAEPNFFPFIEFDDAQLPWMFTPARANDTERLIPWVALVVVREVPNVVLETVTQSPGHRLSIKAGAGAMLPRLDEAHAWAHAEASDPDSPLPDRSRLLCPVRLDPREGYLACLVPTFEAGRLAGLGRAAEAGGPLLAWGTESNALDLPVYFHWRFGTGAADFEELVRRLQPHEAGEDVGVKLLDISVPRAGMNADELVPGWDTATRVHVSYTGALVSPVAQHAPWDYVHRTAFQGELGRRLLAAGAPPAPTGTYNALEDDPVVGLPDYGTWQAGDQDPAAPDVPQTGWRAETNLNAPARSQAGVGASIVRRLQEELMTEAWAVAANHRDISGVLQRARLAQCTGSVMHRRIGSMETEPLLQLTEPVHDALIQKRGPRGVTFTGIFEASNTVPAGAFDAQFHRATLRADAVLRRTAMQAATPMQQDLTAMMISGASLSQMQALPNRVDGILQNAPIAPGGIVSGHRLSMDRAMSRAGLSGVYSLSPAGPAGGGSGHGILRQPQEFERVVDTPNPPPAAAMRNAAVAQLDPETTVTAVTHARIDGLKHAPHPEVAPIPATARVSLEFRRPTYLDLQAVSPELLLPGYGSLPDNSVTLLEINRAFIEAFHVGLNHEMSRELAWRQYPADLRSTWMRTFWDYPDQPERRDITPIADWFAPSGLGAHEPPDPTGTSAEVVVLVKGDLFRRYPDTLVYAAPAVWSPLDPAATPVESFRPAKDIAMRRTAQLSDESAEVWPTFEGVIGSKGAFFGLPLSASNLRGSQAVNGTAGWFVVFEQPVTEARFGLDAEGDFGTAPAHRNALAWSNFAADAAALQDLAHAPLDPDGWTSKAIGPLTWGDNAAQQAALCFQDRVRVAMHADSLIAEGAP